MNVDFVSRSDSNEKFGGDSLQLDAYMSRLAEVGHDVRAVPFRADLALRPGAIVHVLNIDRPYDFLDTMRQARGHDVVVSPIHHSLVDVRRMRRAESGYTARALVGRAMPESVRELCAFGVRTSRHSTLGATVGQVWESLRDLPHVWARVGEQLDRSAAVALLANGEGRALRADTGWAGRNAVLVPNGLPDGLEAMMPRAWSSRATGLVVVGRIEPRKRQAELAEAAARRGIAVTFAGELNASAGAYGRRFLRVVDSAEHVRWVGRLPHDETLRLLGDSRVLVNASWVEVQSLVDLEAAAMGCWVVTSPAGHSAEWLGGAVREVDGTIDDILDVAARQGSVDYAPPPLACTWTWDDAAAAIDAIYRRLEGTPA